MWRMCMLICSILIVLINISCSESDCPAMPEPQKIIGFSSPFLSVSENSTEIYIGVFRTYFEDSAKVDISVRYGTAEYGEDYYLTDSQVVFPPGVQFAGLYVVLMDDYEVEEREIAYLKLERPSSPYRVMHGTNTVMMIIQDDESTTYSSSIHYPLEVGNHWSYNAGITITNCVDSDCDWSSHVFVESDSVIGITNRYGNSYYKLEFDSIKREIPQYRELRQEGQALWSYGSYFPFPMIDGMNDQVASSYPWKLVDFSEAPSGSRTLFETPIDFGEPFITVTTTNLGRTSVREYSNVHVFELCYSERWLTTQSVKNEKRTIFVADSVGVVEEQFWKESIINEVESETLFTYSENGSAILESVSMGSK
jgi:Calx-beta domain